MIKGLIQSVLRSMGYQLCKYPSSEGPTEQRLKCFLKTWKEYGSSPELIVDIGANRGGWTREVIKYFPNARYIMVEPQEQLRSYSDDLLKSGKVRWVNAGIGEVDETLRLALHPRDDSASFTVEESEARRRNMPMVEVPVYSLNTLLAEESVLPGIIKVDAEGLDLAVLKGASRYLGSVDVFLVECAIANPRFSNRLAEVVSVMAEHGYRVFDVTDLNCFPDRNTLWLVELVFVKNDHSVWEKIGNLSSSYAMSNGVSAETTAA